jgi:hypothetical protein
MFLEEPLRVSVRVPALRRTFYSLREFCTTYGLIEQQTYLTAMRGDPCFHYGWDLKLRKED